MSIAQWWCRISPETWIHRRPEAVWIVPSLEETSFALPKRLGTDCKFQRINHFHRLIWPGGPSNSTLSVWAPWSTCWSGWCRAILFCYDLSCPLKKTAQRNRNTSKLRENLNAWTVMMVVVMMMTIGMGFMRCLIKLENDTSWFIQATFCASPSMSTHLLRAKGCNGKCVSGIGFCKFKRYNMWQPHQVSKARTRVI